MDQKAAEEYHTLILQKLSKRANVFDRLIWIPLLGISSFYALDGIAGATFGCALGWGICAILSSMDALTQRRWEVEYFRHLHEHTNEVEAGERAFRRNLALEKVLKKWWHF